MIQVSKASLAHLEDVQSLINEYYEALDIQKRDSPQVTAAFLEASATSAANIGIWIAYEAEDPVGCVVLRNLDAAELTIAGFSDDMVIGEVKRLFVKDLYRGRGVANMLMEALERFATKSQISWIYLDSKDDLLAAITLYTRRGYAACPRYNINPQATIFLRKQILSEIYSE